jgi:hypothetical protein
LARFDGETLSLLDSRREVDIETMRLDGTKRRTIIWVVVVDGEVYVRSWKGDRGYWYQAALEMPDEVALRVDGRVIPVRAIRVIDEVSIARCSAGLEIKYAGDPSTPGMVRSNVLETTMRLEPR